MTVSKLLSLIPFGLIDFLEVETDVNHQIKKLDGSVFLMPDSYYDNVGYRLHSVQKGANGAKSELKNILNGVEPSPFQFKK
ncbi:MAG: hypothetical protein ACKVOR_06070 [Flavobacteriales bacterium]